MRLANDVTLRRTHVLAAVASIRSRTTIQPRIALVLGSGLEKVLGRLQHETTIPTNNIPHYPKSTVEGHRGNIVIGSLGKTPLLIFQGRVHFYETGDIASVLYPIHVADELGVTTLILTNAAGGVRTQFRAGDLMVIEDQINLTFKDPGRVTSGSTYHTSLFDEELIRRFITVGKKLKIPMKCGTYCGVQGPSYETAAEIEMIHRIGGDAVGMSTVNEASLAKALGMRVAGISCITNLATGKINQKLSHRDVTDVARAVRASFTKLLTEFIGTLPPSGRG